ncbi:MAG: hypothetical protein K9M98_03245 [Cephaloticoccus sp.]|nr:hypothetical protein [Cephaloticoccus sp.]
MSKSSKSRNTVRHSPPVLPAGWWTPLALFGIVLAFALIRGAGMFNDLWLDEIWSIRMMQSISAPWEILTKVQHDNNHPLNALFIYLISPVEADWMYRMFSWVTGSVTVGLAAMVATRLYQRLQPDENRLQPALAGLFSAPIIGGAYLLIHYSSEARGYAPAVAFALLAFYALLRASENNWGKWAALYGAACVLGLLSHLAVVQVMLAAVGWTLVTSVNERDTWRNRITRALGWHLVPWLFFVAYYFGFVRHLEIGEGPQNSLGEVLRQVAVYSLGFPASWGGVALVVGAAMIFGSLFLVGRKSGALATFFVLVIAVTPLLGLGFSRFSLLFPRYFIISVVFALIAVGFGVTRLWLRAWGWQIVVATALALFLLGNGLHVSHLWHEGRGQYRAALREIAARTPSDDISIGSDHDFRNFALVDYYRNVVGPRHRVIYVSADKILPGGVQWLLLHRLDGQPAPAASVTDVLGNRYVQEGVYPHAPLSGWDWYVYRNVLLRPRR